MFLSCGFKIECKRSVAFSQQPEIFDSQISALPKAASAPLTPMMRQYFEIKGQYKDCILFFRLGDFYEMFSEDAQRGAKILGIVLTHRHGTPMCGIPYHSVDQYLAKLTAAGEKVALCEQVSDPTLPGIVKREVVRVVTPGTTFSEVLLDQKTNNYVVAILPQRNRFGLATIDITTGSFGVTEVEGYDQLALELQRLKPRECLLPLLHGESSDLKTLCEALDDVHVYFHSTPQNPEKILTHQLKISTVEALGLGQWPIAVNAAGFLVEYLRETQKNGLIHLKRPKPYLPGEFMLLDEATLRNLELLSTFHDHKKEGSLLGVLDRTQTAMGGRLLKQWTVRPLTEKNRIQVRLDAVENFIKEGSIFETLWEEMGHILDLERSVARLSLERGTPRDAMALKSSLQRLPLVKSLLSALNAPLLAELQKKLQPLPDLVSLIDASIVEEPPLNLKEGGFIREGFHEELDELRSLSREGKGFIKNLQQQEIQRTGISSLKVKYNRVFGYYIEISKSNLGNVPENYTRKQTLVNAERYITPELKTYEEKVLTAEDKSKALEAELFRELRETIMESIGLIQQNAEAIAELDVLLSFTSVALKNRYVKPQLRDDFTLTIQGGRHPVVETMNPSGDFIPNDTHFNAENQQILLITGPNMSGKSTFLRQVALISLMAQIGSYVPAQSAEIAVVDRIFTRVGASDNLSKGQSTFMVEMQEAANILNNATARSLIILDEIGRGTSTYDGLSIAWAILEYLHQQIGAKTLFATHYHELIAVTERLERAQNYCVLVHEDTQNGVVFLHKIQAGGIDKSYGIEVAKLAGLPRAVIEKAQHILKDLEEGVVEKGIPAELQAHHVDRSHSGLSSQGLHSPHPIAEKLKKVDVNHLTPMEALQLLVELKRDSEMDFL